MPPESARLTIGQNSDLSDEQPGHPTTEPYRTIPVNISVGSALLELGRSALPYVAKLATGSPRENSGDKKDTARNRSWIPGVVVAIGVVYLHDAFGDGNLVNALARRDEITTKLVGRLDRQDARIEQLEGLATRVANVEDTQDKLLQAHRDAQAVRAWRDDATIAIAKAQGLTLNPRPEPIHHIERKKQ